ncbi:(Na+)-NQR maturation NqrM [Tropicimonas sp. IMCC6043]|uniref:(Na+)-NQR maturation NqrM n=1 Tax=Tropicimonas sp. IMCC6043 TaxID=2510645 RepID=UPI00101B92FB|nr:(Na+)-NQR maturation NqrM [Tropicimonas sp. IMCC6043]RYH09760.1 (Na+)-NQR maturation NqrM [Tropicimonas sp. IMCC6043]
MATFLLAFLLLGTVFLAMAVGVILVGQRMRIKGSCGGLNAIAGADKCVVCQQDIDPDSPLRDRIHCKRAQRMAAEMGSR